MAYENYKECNVAYENYMEEMAIKDSDERDNRPHISSYVGCWSDEQIEHDDDCTLEEMGWKCVGLCDNQSCWFCRSNDYKRINEDLSNCVEGGLLNFDVVRFIF